MKQIKHFLLNWLHYAILLHASSKIFRGQFVLGNKNFDRWIAVVVSGLILVILIKFGLGIIEKTKKIKLNTVNKLIVFFIVNFVSFWIVARIAPYSGFGVTRFTWLLLLSAFTTLVYSWEFK